MAKKIRLYDRGNYLGTFNPVSAGLEAKRLGGEVKLGRERPSHIRGEVVREASARRTGDTPVRVLQGIQPLGEMTWTQAKALAKVNKLTLKIVNTKSNPQTVALIGSSAVPLKKG